MQLDRCKSCGGELDRIGNCYVCKFCGSRWMIDADNDVHVIDRANAWSALRDCDFERAAELFENIIFKEPENHEAYWGRALANAGIIYVTDLDENKKVPTCNSISESSFVDSRDTKKAIELAPDEIAQSYKAQAEQIEAIRVEWVKKASREPAYDVFISYKDSDRENGIKRTDDSYDAHELYNALTAEGYKVFYSRVSLCNKISERYEPYIYNAIKTAKVMIVFGEKPEYFNAVWVKNEWMRFRKRIEQGEKHPSSLVVAYKGIDPADLPVGLRSRQCLDASSFTFLEDLKEHILKIKQSDRYTSNTHEKESVKPVTINPLHEHLYRDEIVPSTCVAKGYTLHTCDCGYKYRDSYTPLVDHIFKTTNTVAPSCQSDGREEKVCDVCGEKTTTRIPAPGHQYTKWVEVKRPTCTEGGESQRQCTECGSVEKKVTDPTEHRYSAWVTTTSGKQTCDCLNCGHTQTRENTYYSFNQTNKDQTKTQPSVDPWLLFWLCLFGGVWGLHHFAEKKVGKGILHICTAGLFYVGWIVDCVKYYKAAKYGGQSPADSFVGRENELEVISMKDIFRNWKSYQKSFFSRETTKTQKLVRYTGQIFLWSWTGFICAIALNSTLYETISLIISVISLIALVIDMPIWIGSVIALSIEKRKNKSMGLPREQNIYARTGLKAVSASLLLCCPIFACVTFVGIVSGDASAYPAIMLLGILAIWAVITSFLAHCPKKYKKIQTNKGRVFAKARVSQLGVVATVVCFFVMLVWVSLVS